MNLPAQVGFDGAVEAPDCAAIGLIQGFSNVAPVQHLMPMEAGVLKPAIEGEPDWAALRRAAVRQAFVDDMEYALHQVCEVGNQLAAFGGTEEASGLENCREFYIDGALNIGYAFAALKKAWGFQK